MHSFVRTLYSLREECLNFFECTALWQDTAWSHLNVFRAIYLAEVALDVLLSAAG